MIKTQPFDKRTVYEIYGMTRGQVKEFAKKCGLTVNKDRVYHPSFLRGNDAAFIDDLGRIKVPPINYQGPGIDAIIKTFQKRKPLKRLA